MGFGSVVDVLLVAAWITLAADNLLRARHPVVTRGPYALVRHPLYLGILLLAAGSALAHPSLAVVSAAAGLAAGIAYKIPGEERALRATCGDAYARYAAEVPALFPRLSNSH